MSAEVLATGRVISNRYEIQSQLGRGKFSIVYVAKDIQDGSKCALKKINIFDMMDPKQREKCLKEVNLLRNIDHPHVVKFLQSFIENNELYIFVEWAERGDLKRMIRKAQQKDPPGFAEITVSEYVRQISGALDHMHNLRILHRDLKPANIFIATDGALKLGDLGLGRLLTSQTMEAFSKVGTPLYMSPEVLKSTGYGVQSDMWSLGCVSYELCMLQSPFKQNEQVSLYELFNRISKGVYPPIKKTFHPELVSIVDKMLSLDPQKRPTAKQVEDVATIFSKAQRAPPPVFGLLVMEDVLEKLKLLNYEQLFLRPRQYRPFHKTSFIWPWPEREKMGKVDEGNMEHSPTISQPQMLLELLTWIRNLRHRTKDPDGAAGPSYIGGGDSAGGLPRDNNLQQLEMVIDDIGKGGVKITQAMKDEAVRGYGDNACLLVNDALNRELISRDFHFTPPRWDNESLYDEVVDILVSDDEELELSLDAESEEYDPVWEEPSVPTVELMMEERDEPLWRNDPLSDVAARMQQYGHSVVDAAKQSEGLLTSQIALLRNQLNGIREKESRLSVSNHPKHIEALRLGEMCTRLEVEAVGRTRRMKAKMLELKDLSRQVKEKNAECDEVKISGRCTVEDMRKALDKLCEETRDLGTRSALVSAELFRRTGHRYAARTF